MTTNTNEPPTISGPAVIFDAAALPSWLAEPIGADTDQADELGIDETDGRAHGTLLSGLGDLLDALAEDEQTVWRLRPGVRHVGFFRTYDGDGGCDGAIITVDLENGVRLASLHHDHKDFASVDSHGVPAAVEALSNLADEANTTLGTYQAATGAGGQLTDRQLCIPGGVTEEQFRDLEAAMGLPRLGLGRYKEWAADRPVYLGLPHDLDAAIRFLRRTGLAYTESRETRFEAAAPTPDPARD